jgi:hypothetical protein
MVSEKPDIYDVRVLEVHSDEKNADFNSGNIPAQFIINSMHLILRNVRASLNHLIFHGIDTKLRVKRSMG